jgi:hypothetical protein
LLTIRPKHWEEFQHYKHRQPPWVKLHRSILDNYDYHRLQDASKALAPYLWLLASEFDEGNIPLDPPMIAFRLRSSVEWVKSALNPLINNGFFICSGDASDLLADCKQDALLETEKSKSREEAEKSRVRVLAQREPAASNSTWEAYSHAYEKRYGALPIRNATINSQIKQILKRLGEEEAPSVAAHYVSLNSAFYVQRGHAVGNLLADCEKIRTEWATGRSVTQASARMTDETQTRLDVWGPIIAEEKARKLEQANGK